MHTAQHNGATLAIIDTSPHAEPAALDAAKATHFALVPCRPSIFDLQAVELTVQIADMAQVKTHIVFNAPYTDNYPIRSFLPPYETLMRI
ncbi:MAG: hypothetical protein OXI63_26230 [Candidatus Poribacteria bacterium]|nr:hypothetical protein [Candidatus Poribacteria bacterium]